jgi:DNA anti-recombination protein RmuC
MDMENLAELLEEELAEAFEVKNRKSLHRYVLILTQQHVAQHRYEADNLQLRSEIKEAVRSMEQGFQHMDERFEETNKRFEDMNHRFEDMNHRFDTMNQRFSGMLKFVGIGFAVLALIIAGFNTALLLAG